MNRAVGRDANRAPGFLLITPQLRRSFWDGAVVGHQPDAVEANRIEIHYTPEQRS